MNFKGDGSAAGTVTWEGDIIIYGNPLLKTYLVRTPELSA